MVITAARLIRTQGVSGTGLREVVEAADAPRGSLQHYFPGGKDQLVVEALEFTASYAARRVERAAAGLRTPTPSKLFSAIVDQWRSDFRDSDFTLGCPLVAATADMAAGNEAIRGALASAFERWQQPVAAALRDMGVPRARAAGLASLMISALEGAIVQARATQSLAPLNAVTRELAPLLDGAVSA
jgi:AcrR family transcriptional regulator